MKINADRALSVLKKRRRTSKQQAKFKDWKPVDQSEIKPTPIVKRTAVLKMEMPEEEFGRLWKLSKESPSQKTRKTAKRKLTNKIDQFASVNCLE